MKKRDGLGRKQAEKLLEKFGPNSIRDVSKATPLKLLIRQVKSNFMVYLLFAAMLISFFVGKSVTAYTILAVIFMVVFFGFVQEYKSEKAIGALKDMIVPVSIVIRDGKEQEVKSSSLVPGDIVVLRNGEKVPADCVILEESELRVNESVLTGESREIRKTAGKESDFSDENMVFMGTFVVNGRAIAKVTHTGMNTKFGKIAGMISETEKELPLQKKVNRIAEYMASVAIIVSVLTGMIMLYRAEAVTGDVIVEILILIIALSVSAFPEGFPVVLITTLSSGAYRMAKLNAIVNRMSIIETLGETTVICSDKTGTITKGEMTVKKIFAEGSLYDVSGVGYESKGEFSLKGSKVDISHHPFFESLFSNAVLCNDASIERIGEDDEFKARGSPTESALLIMAAKAGVYREDLDFERLEEIPFNSSRKMMSVLCRHKKQRVVYAKGAPEFLLKHCSFIQKKSGISKMTEKDRKEILKANQKMAMKSLRTLAFAFKNEGRLSKDNFENNLVFTALAGMEDPPRDEVKDSILQCERAGIKVKMITGDNKETALSVAGQIGLKGRLVEGSELDEITDDELSKIIGSVVIFARVKPEHKLRIIKALKANGEIVTMTGDGVNDAPALKEAHIGVAMGKNGTDVSRSVADLTLKDDHFSTIVLAIKEGRTIFKNIRKFVTYQLSCNFAELAILFTGVLLAPLLGWKVPILLALQILFMNLVTDNLPAITLGFNPPSSDIMEEKPRKNAEILNSKLVVLLLFTGALLTLFVLAGYYIVHNVFMMGEEYSRTVALLVLIILEITSAFNFRSFRKGVLNRGMFANKYLVYASAVSFIATLVVIYSPANKLFETVPLGPKGFIIGIAAAALLIIIFDVLKLLNSKLKILDVSHL